MTARLIKRRRIIFSSVIIAIFIIFAFVLIKIQGVDGEYYSGLASYTTTKSMTVDAARGEILDCNGIPIVKNRSSNKLVFVVGEFPSVSEQKKRNKVLYELINLLESKGETRTDTIPLTLDSYGNASYSEDKKSDIAKLLKNLSLESDASADECFERMVEVFKLSEYSPGDALKIASVCNNMINMEYSSSNPYIFANDVSSYTASIIKENSNFFTGVEINTVYFREYVDSTLAVHVLGPVGIISEEEYEEYKDKGYSINDEIGKSGIEKAFEDYLRGTQGVLKVTTLSDGTFTNEYVVEPKQGNTVMLTLDSNVQRVAEDALESTILSLREKAQSPKNTSIGDVTGGAVVVVDVNSGAILASASYPSYDLNEYFSKYSSLLNEKNSPLWNRATMSTYAPGSTVKPLISLAALQTGTITEYTTVYCQKVYTYYQSSGLLLYCLQAHGNLNVTGAIFNSCNCFYYDVGRKLGISAIDEYMGKFGLAKKTGVEIGEAQGNVAGPEYRKSIGQDYWYDADTSQAAIGQSDHAFTVLQLANYCAAVANGGTRYKLHYVDKVIDSETGETVYSAVPEILEKIDIDEHYFDVVRNAMRLVATEGAVVGDIMKDSPVEAAAKTGSAQVSGQASNGFFISFAPYSEPEIAVAIVIEQAGSGASATPIARDIYKYYFEERYSSLQSQEENQLLK